MVGFCDDLVGKNLNAYLAVNIHSFSEAPISSIRKWIQLISTQKIEYLFIVPSSAELLSLELDGTRVDYAPLLEEFGYQIVTKEAKFGSIDCELSPASYFLFSLDG